MSHPIVSITENDDGFVLSIDNGTSGTNLRVSLETLEAINDSVSDFINSRAVEDLGDFSLDDGVCDSCMI